MDIHIEGLRIDTADKEPSHDEKGIPRILAGTKAVIRLFGTGITKDTLISFTDVPADRGVICDKIKSNEFPVSISSFERKTVSEKLIKCHLSMFKVENVADTTATIRVVLPLGSSFYVCAKRPLYEKEKLMKNDVLFRHQGTALYNTVSIFFFWLPHRRNFRRITKTYNKA